MSQASSDHARLRDSLMVQLTLRLSLPARLNSCSAQLSSVRSNTTSNLSPLSRGPDFDRRRSPITRLHSKPMVHPRLQPTSSDIMFQHQEVVDKIISYVRGLSTNGHFRALQNPALLCRERGSSRTNATCFITSDFSTSRRSSGGARISRKKELGFSRRTFDG